MEREPLVPAALSGVRALTPGGWVADARISFDQGRIARIDEAGAPASGDIVASGLIALPGFIDLQTNGALGLDCMSADPDVHRALARCLPAGGCTSFLPTIVTASPDRTERALAAIYAATGPGPGASIVGAHLEGPWIGGEAVAGGAHDASQVRPFSADEWRRLAATGRNAVRVVTLAPEAPANLAAIPALCAEGVAVSIGHTGADYECALAAINRGASLATHTYNAMRGFSHREPGALGAVLTDPRVAPMVIPDGIHTHPAAVRLLVRARGADAVIAVTDSFWCAGLPAGPYRWGSETIELDGSAARLRSGRLAGSTLTMIAALRNLIAFADVDLAAAGRMVATNPARALGLIDRGELAPGKRADVVLVDDSLTVAMTLVAGRIAFASDLGKTMGGMQYSDE